MNGISGSHLSFRQFHRPILLSLGCLDHQTTSNRSVRYGTCFRRRVSDDSRGRAARICGCSSGLGGDELRELFVDLGAVSGAGRCGLLALPVVAELARSERLLRLVRPHLPAEPLPVRAIYFDKSPDTNWLVPWHQDLTIALRAKAEVPGFGPWSTKDGIPHVQPPVELLQQMLTVRVHLDDTDESNGALRVLPGSHRLGRLAADRIQLLRREQPDFLCTVSAGDVLLMRPLLLHASSRSTSTRHRRILHIEYAGFPLPEALNWQEAA